jgi:hypothetical protein
MLLGHKIGLATAYYRPTDEEIYQEYLKAVDLLTINEENRLKIENEQLREENKYGEYIINGKIEETYKEIQTLKQRQLDNVDVIATLSDKVDELMEKISLLNSRK